MRPFYVFDRWGTMVDAVAWPLEAVHDDSVEDDDTLKLTVRGVALSKGQRVVWSDRFGHWHEHIVSDLSDVHSDGELYQTVTCENSITELMTDWLEEVEPKDASPRQALERALSGTNWSVGTVTATGTSGFSWYHTDPHEAVAEIAETFEAEIQTTIEVAGSGVASRSIDVLAQRGTDRGCLFAVGRNVTGVTREVSSDDVVTALYGYGKSQTTEAGGQSRKLTFGSINGGKDYVEDLDALAKWGVPDGHGGKRHAFGQVEFSNCEDAAELMALTKKRLETVSKPQVTYTADVISLAEVGLTQGDEVDVGDVIHVRDPELGERIETRALEISRDLLDESATKITFGTREPTFTGTVSKQQKTVQDLNDRADSWDATSETVENVPGKWLQQVMDRLNQEFDNAGQCYKYTSLEKGDIYSTVPLDEDGKPTKTPASAIQLCGLGFRIASKVEGGDFKWETFGTGEGFTANLINVGTLRCGDNFINLDTGELHLALTATVGDSDSSLDDYVEHQSTQAASSMAGTLRNEFNDALDDYVPTSGFDSMLNMRNVASALTNGFVDKGLFIQQNHVVFNGDYVRTGVIESQNGNSFFDLDNGYLEAVGNIYSVGQYHEMHSRLINGQLDLIMDQTPIGTLATYTRSNNANVHITGLKAFTTLVLSGPGIGVSNDSTVSSGLTWTDCIDCTINHVAGVYVTGSTATFDLWTTTVQHGLVTGQANIADVQFSAGTRSVNLLASVEPVAELEVGQPMQVVQITSQDELDRAAEEGRMVWIEGDETGSLAEPVYTGEEWTMDEPTAHKSDPIVLPLADYVDAQTSLIQAELEAVADSLGDSKLKAQMVKARNAIASGSAERIATVSKAIQSTPVVTLKASEGGE